MRNGKISYFPIQLLIPWMEGKGMESSSSVTFTLPNSRRTYYISQHSLGGSGLTKYMHTYIALPFPPAWNAVDSPKRVYDDTTVSVCPVKKYRLRTRTDESLIPISVHICGSGVHSGAGSSPSPNNIVCVISYVNWMPSEVNRSVHCRGWEVSY